MRLGICQDMIILAEISPKCACLRAICMAWRLDTSIIKDKWVFSLPMLKAYISLPKIIMAWANLLWRSTAIEHECRLNRVCLLIQA